MTDLKQELLAAELEGWRALADGRGGEHYREHLSPNAAMAFPFGVMSRQEAIAAMDAAPPWSTYELIEPHVVELSSETGVLAYRVEAQRAGDEPYTAIVSSIYVRGDGQWLLAFHQQSPAPH